jgi:hypothetical protein
MHLAVMTRMLQKAMQEIRGKKTSRLKSSSIVGSSEFIDARRILIATGM